ncbi:hypothetical protein Y1Q_0007741 [Alligator mississippiensis]|uniref:T-cell receptor alpha chain constant domain-containing protein n=1 Tax=Alligator mississippiensis TaxID=8496 RepID=A0A151NBZ6_ALLMI|nr:hypothetical protein Y1Q_0007741 [Alligator mississippiensis]
MVAPNLPDSIPSVYKLESSKASISACLITDYYPDNIIITDRDGLNKSFQSSIVEVKDPGSNTKEASYGAVYWSQYDFQDDIKYGLNYKTRCRESAEDEEETCTTMEMSHDFETDEHLNLLSFTVLELRCERNVDMGMMGITNSPPVLLSPDRPIQQVMSTTAMENDCQQSPLYTQPAV